MFRKEESMSTYPNINKIKNEINWTPKIKFKNGIIKTKGKKENQKIEDIKGFEGLM